MRSLEGRVAVVTGGGRGIGASIARLFAREGCTVVVSSRTKNEIDAIVADIEAADGNAVAVVADSMARDSACIPVDTAIAHFGRIDILVNNAGGVVGSHSTLGGGDQSFEATILLNLIAPWWTSSAVLPGMTEQGHGRIMNIGSTESLRANLGCPPAYDLPH